jgi:hypothetical protein
VRIAVQGDRQASQQRQTKERRGEHQAFRKIERGTRRDAETTQQGRLQAVEAGAAGSNAIRRAYRLKMLNRAFPEGTLRPQYGEGQRLSLRRHERGRGDLNEVQLAHRLRGGAVFVTDDHSEVDPRFLNRLREGSIAFDEEFDLHARIQRSELRQD